MVITKRIYSITKQVKEQLSGLYDVRQVAIFGSVLTGRPHRDIDIAVEVQPCHTCKDGKLNILLSKMFDEKIDVTFTDSIAKLFDKLRVKDFIVVD